MNNIMDYSFVQNTDELKKLILENPDLPIVVLAGEDANIGSYYWMFCGSISFDIGEVLDCDFYDYDDAVFCDRDRLEEYIEDMLVDECEGMSDEEFENAVKNKMAEFEPYWKKVIAIYATN